MKCMSGDGRGGATISAEPNFESYVTLRATYFSYASIQSAREMIFFAMLIGSAVLPRNANDTKRTAKKFELRSDCGGGFGRRAKKFGLKEVEMASRRRRLILDDGLRLRDDDGCIGIRYLRESKELGKYRV